MPRDHWLTQPEERASGLICPRHGGATWAHEDGGSGSFECRIGDRFTEAEMWIAHSVARNRALLAAARALAEHAALARQLAGPAERRGDIGVAARLQEEARRTAYTPRCEP
jgi:hypothetical protein